MALNLKNSCIINPPQTEALSFGQAKFFTRAEVWAKDMG
jgi:hypothetical protein